MLRTIDAARHVTMRGAARQALIAVELFFGAWALLGGLLLMSDPQGHGTGLATTLLWRTPFTTWIGPGALIALSLGILPIVVATAEVQRQAWARPAHALVGMAFVVLVVLQLLLIPALHGMQAVVLLLGLCVFALGILYNEDAEL